MTRDTIDLPRIGLGTVALRGATGAEQMRTAIQMGYRMLDTAYNYENEGAVGRAITRSGIPREDLVVTSKLPGRYHGHYDALTALEESTFRLGLDYLDLYLIHWPNPGQGRFVEAWNALIEARDRGMVRHIGVSNFLPEHIAELERETGELPAVNQVELHPMFPQNELRQWHRERGIAVQAWSPLGRGEMLGDPTILQAADNEQLTPGELILAWHGALGTIPLPRSTSADRQRQNLRAVEKPITAQSVEALAALGADGGRLWNQDPAEYEEF